MRHDFACGDRTRRPASEWNDAKRAAVIASVLDLHIGARSRSEAVDHMQRLFAHAHDVVYLHARARRDGETGEGFRAHFFGIADDVVDFRHIGETLRFRLRCTAGDNDPRVRLVATKTPDRLRRLPNGFARDRAGVDDHRVIEASVARVTAHHLRFIGIEPAAERNDFSFGH